MSPLLKLDTSGFSNKFFRIRPLFLKSIIGVLKRIMFSPIWNLFEDRHWRHGEMILIARTGQHSVDNYVRLLGIYASWNRIPPICSLVGLQHRAYRVPQTDSIQHRINIPRASPRIRFQIKASSRSIHEYQSFQLLVFCFTAIILPWRAQIRVSIQKLLTGPSNSPTQTYTEKTLVSSAKPARIPANRGLGTAGWYPDHWEYYNCLYTTW